MRMLLLALLAASSAPARAEECANPSTPKGVAQTLALAEEAWRSADENGFLLRMEEAHLQVPCLSSPIPPALAARYHRDAGLWMFVSGQKQLTTQAFAAAKRVEGGHVLPPDMLPAGHPARALFEAAGATASTPAPTPAAGRLLFDGGVGDRPTDSPTIAQLARDAGGLAWSAYLRPDQALPEYAIAAGGADATPVAAAPGGAGEPTRARDRGASGALRWTLVGTAGALAVGGGAMGMVARSTQKTFLDAPPADGGELTDLYDRIRTASTTSAVLLGAAGAVGVGAVFAW